MITLYSWSEIKMQAHTNLKANISLTRKTDSLDDSAAGRSDI